MSPRRCCALAFLLAFGPAARAGSEDPPFCRFLPERPWIVLELRDAPGLARGLERSAAWSSIWSAILHLLPNAESELVKMEAFERALVNAGGSSGFATFGDLLGPRMHYWIEGAGAWGLVITPREPRLVARTLLEIQREQQRFGLSRELREFAIEGAPGWSMGEGFHLLRAGDSYLVGPRREIVERAFRRGRDGARAVQRSTSESSSSGATLWIDGELVRRSEGVVALPEKLREPMVNLLFGSYLAPLLAARPIGMELSWSEDLATLRGEVIAGDSRELESYWRALVAPRSPAFAVPSFASAPGYLGRLRFQRDWARWWREKDSRWSEAGRAGIRDLEQLLALLLKGEDFAEALADVEGPLELLLVLPRFEEESAPAHRYPAAALVIGLEEASRGEIFERSFRTLLGISNAERVKRGFSTLKSSAAEEGGFRVVRSRWEEGSPELARVEGNLSPAFARCAHVAVLASSEQALDAALQVLRTVPHEGPAGSASAALAGDLLEMDGGALARLIEFNREAIVFARVLNEGEELAQAENMVAYFEILARAVERVRISMRLDDERARAVLAFELEMVGGTR